MRELKIPTVAIHHAFIPELRLPALWGGIVKVVASPAEGQVIHTPPQCVA